jgi:carbonic anhydrase
VRSVAGAEDLLEQSIRAHSVRVADGIRRSQPVFSDLARQELQVVAAYYDLVSGRVDWLEA